MKTPQGDAMTRGLNRRGRPKARRHHTRRRSPQIEYITVEVTLSVAPPEARPLRLVLAPWVDEILEASCDDTDEPVVLISQEAWDEIFANLEFYQTLRETGPLQWAGPVFDYDDNWSPENTILVRNQEWLVGLQAGTIV